MDKATFEEYVESRYNKQMEYYRTASAKNQKKYKLFQWILIILSALTPVLAAMNGKIIGSKTIQLDVTVIVVSAIVAILTSGLKTFNYQELWITYRTIYEKLKPEIYYYNFNVGPYDTDKIDKETMFVTRIEALLDKEHTQWPLAKKITDNSNEADESPTNEKDINVHETGK